MNRILSEWGYLQENGPETWGQKFTIGDTGKRQSPIDFNDDACKETGRLLAGLELQYPKIMKDLRLINIGTGWRVDIPEEYAMKSLLQGGPLEHKYRLAQFHCHWGHTCEVGSEHTVNGKHFAGEIHFVHWNSELFETFNEAIIKDKGIAVIGVFMQCSDEVVHLELEKVTSLLNKVLFKSESISIEEDFCISNLFPKEKQYWAYKGSLTTPPLYESVDWIVFKQPIMVHHNQIDTCRDLYHNPSSDETEELVKVTQNYRPTQNLYGRQVAFVEDQ